MQTSETPVIPTAIERIHHLLATAIERLCHGLANVGRPRQALLVLVFSGTILNLWTALDAFSQVSPYAQSLWDNQIYDVRRLNDYVLGSTASGLNYRDGLGSALRNYNAARLHVWEMPAKVEFALLAGAVCIWLVLPRATASRS
jgi:hypothetical protein